jgi:hypothetical protein
MQEKNTSRIDRPGNPKPDTNTAPHTARTQNKGHIGEYHQDILAKQET